MENPYFDDNTKYIDAEYDEEEDVYYTICPFCGHRHEFMTDDCCDHLIYEYEDINSPEDGIFISLPDEYIDYAIEHGKDMLPEMYDLYSEWFFETSENYCDEDEEEDEDLDIDEYDDAWEDFCREHYLYTHQNIKDILTSMGHKDLADKLTVVGEYDPEGYGHYIVYIPDND